MPTLTVKVSQYTDDAYSPEGTDTTALNGTEQYLGEGLRSSSPKRANALRFNNITIPPGATITEAYFRLCWHFTQPGISPIRVWGDYQANAPTWAFPNPDALEQITPTTANVIIKDDISRTEGVYSRIADDGTDDIKSIVQEIIGHPSWASGNSMRFVCEGYNGDSDYQAYPYRTYDHSGTSTAPELVIVYTVDAVKVEGYRYRNDDGSESAATWKLPQDIDPAVIDFSDPFRLRLILDTVGDPISGSYQLEYRKVSSPSILLEDFNDNSLDLTTLWDKVSIIGNQDDAVTVVEQNQRLEITPIVSTGSHYNGIRSKATYNFNGKTARVYVIQKAGSMPVGQGYQGTALIVAKDTSNYYEISADGDVDFQTAKVVGGERTNLSATNDYNVNLQKYWRLRHNPKTDVMHFEYSTDLVTWVQVASTPVEFDMTAVKIGLVCGSWGSASPAGVAYFDDFILEDSPDGDWKKVA